MLVEPKPQRIIGQDDGLFEVPDDFDAPLPDEVLMLFQSSLEELTADT